LKKWKKALSKLSPTIEIVWEATAMMYILAASWRRTGNTYWMPKSIMRLNILKYRKKALFYTPIFYLGVTEEYTETHAHVPFLEGKSSTGRLGIDIHATAGKGDVGFCGNWTLEISVKQPVKVYRGMPVGQLIYFPVDGEIEVKYNQKKDAKYSGQPNKPVESMMWKNKF
jgi:deoxycytidine triphosphate deaminase